MKAIYNSLLMSHILYGISVWGGSPNKTLDRLIKLQKKAVRHVYNLKYNSHTNSIFYELRCLKLNDAYRLQCIKIGYKRKLNKLPLYHASRLLFNQEIRQSSTRQDHCIALVKPTALLKINSFNYRIGSAWNSIVSSIRQTLDDKMKSEKCFVQNIKRNILDTYNKPCSIHNCYICRRWISECVYVYLINW